MKKTTAVTGNYFYYLIIVNKYFAIIKIKVYSFGK